ncbi:MAG TPA: hypothetical protein VFU28_20690 [Vicinamibacterales bacterium]|nr:hypothetical protein [Vicinamibacterales bacterium]
MSARTRHAIVAALGLGAALMLLLHQQVEHLDSVPDLGDPLFSVWRIGWVNHQLFTDPRHLFDANIFYPERLTLTLSDPIVLPALMGAPLLAAGVHPVVAYNLLLLSAFWFSGIAVYLLVERLTASARAAFIAGLTYACCGYRFEHYSHLELQMTQWMPLGLLALHLLIGRDSGSGSPKSVAGSRERGQWWYALAFAATLVAQLYSSMYYAVFFVVYAALVGVGLLIVHRPSIRRLALPVVVSAAIAAIAAVPLVRAFEAAEPIKGQRSEGEVRSYSAVPDDYLRVHRESLLWRNVLHRPVPERTLFPGAAPFTLAVVGMAPPLGAIRLIYTAGLLLSFDGTLGLNGVSYPFFYRWLSPFRGLRAPARFGALVALTLAILAGFGAQRALAWRPSRRYQHTAFAVLVAFVMIDAWPALSVGPVWKEPPSIYDALKYTPGVVIAEMPLLDNETANIPFMYFSLWHWTRMVNGYSGFIPNSYAEFRKGMVFFPDASSIATLRGRGVTYVSVNCGLHYPGCHELIDAMRKDTRLRLAADTQWNEDTVQLYEVLAP